MKDLNSTALRIENNRVFILDQTQLPSAETWLEIRNPAEMIAAIRRLSVRGAPLISIAACAILATYAAETARTPEEILKTATELRESRPTAVNLMLALDAMVFSKRPEEQSTAFAPESLAVFAEHLFEADAKLCDDIADHGAALLGNGENILTHCNTGGLGTTGIGTAIGVLRRAHEQGKNIHVYVDETRPLLQGGRLTTWELEQAGVPYTLICDNMAASLMRAGKIDRAVVGADRIALNGDFANKTGTYSVAVLCKHHGIPFYCAAPRTTVDPDCENGDNIPIEMRDPDEVRGYTGKLVWSVEDCDVYNPAFDVTPGEYLTGLILDSGYVFREDIEAGALKKMFQVSEAKI